MQDDVDRVGARDLGHEREQPVPERERVAGVEPAVGELVGAREGQVVEREELLDAREVEEAVPADLAGDVPQREAEDHSCGEDRPAPGHPHVGRVPPSREGKRGQARREQEDEGERQRGRDEERQRQRAEDERQAPGDRRGEAADPERARDRGAGREHDREAEDQLDDEHEGAHPVSPALRSACSTSPEPSQDATSR